MDDGLLKAFQRFIENHTTFVAHFPLDLEREKIYGSIALDESKATGRSLNEPFQAAAHASREAHQAGLATDDFLRIVDKLAEFVKIVSTMPAPASRPSHDENHSSERVVPPPVSIFSEDKPFDEIPHVSARKRAVLTGVGFFERAYNLLGSTASIAATDAGQALIRSLADSIKELTKLF